VERTFPRGSLSNNTKILRLIFGDALEDPAGVFGTAAEIARAAGVSEAA
jgi:hypothetical protein